MSITSQTWNISHDGVWSWSDQVSIRIDSSAQSNMLLYVRAKVLLICHLLLIVSWTANNCKQKLIGAASLILFSNGCGTLLQVYYFILVPGHVEGK